MSRNWCVKGMLCLYLVVAATCVHARSAGGRVVDDVSASMQDGSIILTFEFTVPVHYQWRFPKGFSDQILISLQPLKYSPELSTNLRENVRIPDSVKDLIEDIYIDGTEGKNILLILQVKSDINPDITHDRKTNGIIVTINKDQIKNKIECNDNVTDKK